MSSILIVFTFLLDILHPFHVSVCDVVVNREDRAIQISQRIFLDDLELALNTTFETKLIIDEKAMKSTRDSLIDLYLTDRLAFIVDGKPKLANYLGSEFEEDGIWCYMEIKGIKKVKAVKVVSKVLLEQFDDQANIIHFKAGNYERSVKLDDKNQAVTFNLPKD